MGRIRRVGVVGAIMALALVSAACGGGGGSGSGSGTAGGSASTGGTERAGAGSPGEGVPATGSAAAAKEAVLREEVSSSEMFFAGEGGPFCQQFTDRGRQRFLGEIAKSLGVRAPCAKVMSGLAAEIGPPIKTLEREVGELTVADVTIRGSAATVALPANAPVTLDESGGRWYLTRGP